MAKDKWIILGHSGLTGTFALSRKVYTSKGYAEKAKKRFKREFPNIKYEVVREKSVKGKVRMVS